MEKDPAPDKRPMDELNEDEKLERVLKCVRKGLDFDFMRTLTHIPGNPFYNEDEKPDQPAP